MRPLLRWTAPLLLWLGVVAPARAQFTDITAPSGLSWYQESWGAAFVDLDGNGLLDLYVGHHFNLPRLYWNTGTWFNAYLHPQPWSGGSDRHGVLVADLIGDASPDLFVTHGGEGGDGRQPNELYRNDGGGTFPKMAGAAGMADAIGRTRCTSGADFDGDHRLDVWIGKAPDPASPNSLFRNTGGSFVDVAAAMGLDEGYGTVGGIWGDFDDDGDPDLFVGGEEFSRPSILWRNEGGTGFTNVSHLFSPPLPVVSGADWGDMDLDGDLDLAVCDGKIGIFDTWAEGDTLTFFFNTRYGDAGLDGLTIPSNADTAWARLRYFAFFDRTLIFLGPSGVNPPPTPYVILTDEYVGAPTFTPGVDLGTYVWRTAPGGDWEIRCSTPTVNYDVFDGWITEGPPITGTIPVDLEDSGFTPGGPKVWRNEGGSFVEVTSAMGLPSSMLNPRDISWVDFDNDGDLDLHVVDMGTAATPNKPDALFRNEGTSFIDVTVPEGVAGGTAGMGDGGLWGDTDNDGDLDLFLLEGAGPRAFSLAGPALFLRNDGARGNSIQIDLIGEASGTVAVGAKVVAVTPRKRVTRWVTLNSWRGFQDPQRIHLGIDTAAFADSLIVEWPSGATQVFLDIPPGLYSLHEGSVVVDAPRLPGRRSVWSVLGPHPQPARGEQHLLLEASTPTRLRAEVYDVAGRLVRVLHDGVLPPGATSLSWNGRDRAGRPVPAGVYFLRVADDAGQVTRRSVRLR